MKDYKLTEGSSVVLDLIRGLSSQVVVIGHGISYFGIFTMLHQPNFPWMQNFAVLMFFLLSGFLIPYSIVRNCSLKMNYTFKHYFIDRVSRIYTTLIPALIFVLILDLLSKNLNPSSYMYTNAFNLKTFVGNLLMLQDFRTFSFSLKDSITSFGSARILWTLAIEWWIYLFFGYLLLVISKKRKLNILNLIIILAFSLVPVYNLVFGRGTGLTTYWLFGALAYLISTLNILKEINKNLKLILIVIVITLSMHRAHIVMNAYDPLVAFSLAIAMWLIIDRCRGAKFSKKAIQLIKFNASYSFTLYIIHYSILDFIKSHFNQGLNPYILFVIAFVIANVISMLIGRYTELGLTKKVKTYLYSKYS
jgi:peptidoglycan/LPS O-acetylase OafA/YrhL